MSPPVLVPQGRCRNYWADSLGSLEEGIKARSLPLVINSVRCKRDDHIAFREMYDLKVPQSLYTSVFNLVRPAVHFKKQRMVADAKQRFSVDFVGGEKKDVLCAIVRAAKDALGEKTGADVDVVDKVMSDDSTSSLGEPMGRSSNNAFVDTFTHREPLVRMDCSSICDVDGLASPVPDVQAELPAKARQAWVSIFHKIVVTLLIRRSSHRKNL